MERERAERYLEKVRLFLFDCIGAFESGLPPTLLGVKYLIGASPYFGHDWQFWNGQKKTPRTGDPVEGQSNVRARNSSGFRGIPRNCKKH